MNLFRARVAVLLGEPVSEPVSGQTPTVPTSYKLGDRTLRKGNKGDDVKELQSLLVKRGYSLGTFGTNSDGIDGSFGEKTETAVARYQEDNGLQADGIAGKETFASFTKTENESTAPLYRLVITGAEAELRIISAQYGGKLETIS